MAKPNQQKQGEIIPKPVLNTPTVAGVNSASKPILQNLPPKKKFILQNKAGKIVATLINRELADNWISTGKKGAVKLTEGVLTPIVLK